MINIDLNNIIDDKLLWTFSYLFPLPIQGLSLLLGCIIILGFLYQQNKWGLQSKVLFFSVLMSVSDLFQHILRLASLSFFSPWIIIAIHTLNYFSFLFHFDAHMNLLVLWSKLYHSALARGKLHIKVSKFNIFQRILFFLFHIFSLLLYFIPVIASIVLYLTNILNENDIQLPIYGAMSLNIVMFDLLICSGFLIYGSILVIKIYNLSITSISAISRFSFLILVTIAIQIIFMIEVAISQAFLPFSLNYETYVRIKLFLPLLFLAAQSTKYVSCLILIGFIGCSRLPQNSSQQQQQLLLEDTIQDHEKTIEPVNDDLNYEEIPYIFTEDNIKPTFISNELIELYKIKEQNENIAEKTEEAFENDDHFILIQ